MMIRVEDLEGTVRKPMARKTARKVLEHIGEWDESVSEEWKARANKLQTKLDDGSPFALAEVYKTLFCRQAAEDVTLSAADRRQLSQCEARLSEELAMAFDRDTADVLRLMESSALA